MSKLVYRENSPYSISVHLVQEYMIRFIDRKLQKVPENSAKGILSTVP